MGKLDSNRFSEMETFVKIVELGGFSATAKHYKKSPSAISKLIMRLEARLKVRLFNRSTRRLQLTAEGQTFYDKSLRVLAELYEAETSILSNQVSAGHLRVACNIPVGRHLLLPIMPEFLRSNPAITADISLTDNVIDLMAEYTDVAIRSGPMKNSTLIARKLTQTRKIVVAAPSYLTANGIPKTPKDLTKHNLLRFNFARIETHWPFQKDKQKFSIKPAGDLEISDGESMRQLALAGAGLARLAAFQIKNDIAAGTLLPVLEDYNPGDLETIYAVYLGQGGHLPKRISVFLDFLTTHIQ